MEGRERLALVLLALLIFTPETLPQPKIEPTTPAEDVKMGQVFYTQQQEWTVKPGSGKDPQEPPDAFSPRWDWDNPFLGYPLARWDENWRNVQPLYFCAPMPYQVERPCSSIGGLGHYRTDSCQTQEELNGWSDYPHIDTEYSKKDHNEPNIFDTSRINSPSSRWWNFDPYAAMWSARGRHNNIYLVSTVSNVGSTRSTRLPPQSLSAEYADYQKVRLEAKERKLFWRVEVTGIKHNGKILRGWYHLKVTIDWDKSVERNVYFDEKTKAEGETFYMVDRLMITARGRSYASGKDLLHSDKEVPMRVWEGGIGEFVEDFPSCNCDFTYKDYHDGSTKDASKEEVCREWNPCKKPSDCPIRRRQFADCGTTPTRESVTGNNYIYRRQRVSNAVCKPHEWRGTNCRQCSFNSQESRELTECTKYPSDYGLPYFREHHVNFRLDQSFCNMYFDLDFVVDGVIFDSRRAPPGQGPSGYRMNDYNIDQYYTVPEIWQYGRAGGQLLGYATTLDNCFYRGFPAEDPFNQRPFCVFPVQRTISTRIVFATEKMTSIDSAEVPGTPPLFYENADPLPSLLPGDKLDCNVELKGVLQDPKKPTPENFFGSIKYVYKSTGTVKDVWDKRGHTLSYFDAEVGYFGDTVLSGAMQTHTGDQIKQRQMHLNETKEFTTHEGEEKGHIYYDQTTVGPSMYLHYLRMHNGTRYVTWYNPDSGYKPEDADPDYPGIRGEDIGTCRPFQPITFRTSPKVFKYVAKGKCQMGHIQRTPVTCENWVIRKRSVGDTITDPALQELLKYVVYQAQMEVTDTTKVPAYRKEKIINDNIWYYKYLKKDADKVSPHCQITQKISKHFKCPTMTGRPWTPKPTVDPKKKKQKKASNYHETEEFTPTLERGMVINNPGAWFIYDSRLIHGVHMVVITFFMMPVSSFFARYFKETFMETRVMTHHLWYMIHLMISFMLVGAYAAGLWRIRVSKFILGVNRQAISAVHRAVGWVSIVGVANLVAFGGIRCLPVLPRKLAICWHWFLGFGVYFLNLVCVLTAIWIPGSPAALYDRSWYKMKRGYGAENLLEPFLLLTIAWIIFDITIHIFMTLKQMKVDNLLGLVTPRVILPAYMPVLSEDFEYDLPGRSTRIKFLTAYITVSACVTVILCLCLVSYSSQHRGLGIMTCSHYKNNLTRYRKEFPVNCEHPKTTPPF